MDSLIQYNNAVNAIKTAILQGQYEAAKGVNRIQLALYFAIGKYLSQHTRKGVWGEGALASISEQLRKELPGLRGFSETQMKDMRRFYEAWNMLDSNSAVATAELQNSENQIDIFHSLSISNIPNFPVEDFFKVPFTHHSAIISVEQFPDLLFFNRELNAMVCIELKLGEFKTSYLGQLFGYLQILDDKVRKPHENPSIGIILCQSANYSYAEYAVRDYSKPMGVATYKTLDDMPERLRKALPDMKKMMDLLKNKEE